MLSLHGVLLCSLHVVGTEGEEGLWHYIDKFAADGFVSSTYLPAYWPKI